MKKLLGTNLTFLFLATSIMPVHALTSTEPAEVVVAQENVPLKTEKSVQYPVTEIKVNQGYRFYHPGLDLDGETGDDIRAIMPGIVESTQYSNYAYGNAIYINHQNGYSSLYAHLSKIFVEPGDSVDMWTIIGDMGSTGRSTGSHLHLEVYQNGSPINPYIVLPQ